MGDALDMIERGLDPCVDANFNEREDPVWYLDADVEKYEDNLPSSYHFQTAKEAFVFVKNNVGSVAKRSPDGSGFSVTLRKR